MKAWTEEFKALLSKNFLIDIIYAIESKIFYRLRIYVNQNLNLIKKKDVRKKNFLVLITDIWS